MRASLCCLQAHLGVDFLVGVDCLHLASYGIQNVQLAAAGVGQLGEECGVAGFDHRDDCHDVQAPQVKAFPACERVVVDCV